MRPEEVAEGEGERRETERREGGGRFGRSGRRQGGGLPLGPPGNKRADAQSLIGGSN